MFARNVSLFVVAVTWLLSNQSIARAAPTPAGDSMIVLNRQIASMILPLAAPRPVQSMRPTGSSTLKGLPALTAVDQRKAEWLTSPAFLAVAAGFTSAERILHYQHAGLDANFWGILNRDRGIRIRFSVRL